MPSKMLIDATHPEGQVVVLRGNRVENSTSDRPTVSSFAAISILAKVTRVEPSLQAAFVDYGGNRHGSSPSAKSIPTTIEIGRRPAGP